MKWRDINCSKVEFSLWDIQRPEWCDDSAFTFEHSSTLLNSMKKRMENEDEIAFDVMYEISKVPATTGYWKGRKAEEWNWNRSHFDRFKVRDAKRYCLNMEICSRVYENTLEHAAIFNLHLNFK